MTANWAAEDLFTGYKKENDVYLACFSACQRSVPSGFASDVLIQEMAEATSILSLKKEHLRMFDYDVRTFTEHRQAILDDLINIKKEISPNLVFLPSLQDVHQDHQTIAQEGVRAFKDCSMLGYELPWNHFSFAPTFFISLDDAILDRKIQAIACYRSQAHRRYTDPEFTRSLAKVRGVQSGQSYAEAFEVLRWIV